MNEVLLLIVGFVIAYLFIALVHYIVNPFSKHLYETYEPIIWHYVFKWTCLKKKVHRKLVESYIKVRVFWAETVTRKNK